MSKKTVFIVSGSMAVAIVSIIGVLVGGNAMRPLSFSGAAGLTAGTESLPSADVFRALPRKEQLKALKDFGSMKGAATLQAYLKQIYPDEPGDDHEIAHVIGEVAYLQKGDAGFDICDSFMRYACYHGVILEAIRQNGYSSDVMKKLGQGCLALQRNRTTITSCIHGIGHGVMWVKSYALLPSYQECEKMFEDELDRFFCYDGVSMENVVRRGERKGAVNDLESNDPLYPCNTMPQQYEAACAREHLHYVRRVFYAKDTIKTQSYCLAFLERRTRNECFGALGNALHEDFFDHPETVVIECGKIEKSYRSQCIGVAATQYAFARKPDVAEKLCEALAAGQDREQCKSSVRYATASL